MVESDNETMPVSGDSAPSSAEAAPKARVSRARKAPPKRAAKAVALAEPQQEPTSEPAPEPGGDAAAAPAKTRSARGRAGAAKKASEAADSAATPPIATPPAVAPVAATTTSLLFVAPDLPPAPQGADPADPSAEQTPSRRTRTRTRGSRGGGDQSSGETEAKNGQGAQSGGRQRQRQAAEVITEPQRVKGSTRLEAKKQRRRDGRDAGRRRTVITESEFLARRESVDRVMAVRSSGGVTDIGVLEDGILVEYYQARSQNVSLIGNVYLGRVQNVLPSMEAAFVDIGRGRNAVLYSGEVDWSSTETGNQPRKIENALKAGDKVLVQVTKDPVGHKGARLTSQVSLPGRYLVYVPNGSMNGISRKLPDTERSRLKAILKGVLPEQAGVIVRTAAEGASEEQLTRDVTRLQRQWEQLSAKAERGSAPLLLHSEPDLLIKIIRDVFNEDFTKMLIAGDEAKGVITDYLEQVAPDLLERVEEHAGEDIFAERRVTEQIQKALDRKVWLPSGGSLVIDRTEAMTVIDVNTGKFVGSGGNLEETVTRNNLEAAEEIVRQLRLRDIGGIIVVDFIDMVLESNRDLVLRRLVECLARDRTKHQVAEVTSLGLVQMTRKKIGIGLTETVSEPAPSPQSGSVEQGGGRGRGGRGRGGKQSQQPAAAAAATHALTDDVKNAVAQIVAGTLGGGRVHADAGAGASAEPTAAAAIELELPAPRRGRRGKSPQAEQLLDAVLDALPEPKPPTRGRTSRRVSVAPIRPAESATADDAAGDPH